MSRDHLSSGRFLSSGAPTNLPLPNSGSSSGILAYSHTSILAPNSKQKSAFAPVKAGLPGSDMGFGASAHAHAGGFGMTGLQAGWTHTFYNVREMITMFYSMFTTVCLNFCTVS